MVYNTHRVSSDSLLPSVSPLSFGTFGTLKTINMLNENCSAQSIWHQHLMRKCETQIASSHSPFCQGFLCLLQVQRLHFCPETIQKMSHEDIGGTQFPYDWWWFYMIQYKNNWLNDKSYQHTLTSSPLMPLSPISPNSPWKIRAVGCLISVWKCFWRF